MSLDIWVWEGGVLGMEGGTVSDLNVTRRSWCSMGFLVSMLSALWWWLSKPHSRQRPAQPYRVLYLQPAALCR